MNNSILTTTNKNTTPHTKLSDEQQIPHNNNKKHNTHRKLIDEQLNPHNNKKHNTIQKAKRRATQSPQQQKTQHHTES
jgi:hypothetical protein